MERQTSICPEPANRPDSRHMVEVTGQVRGVQMRPPGDDGGGEFQLLLDSGDTIVGPYPAEWHLAVASNLQANYMLGAKVRGIGEYSPKGELRRISQIESFDTFRVADWVEAFRRHADLQNRYEHEGQLRSASPGSNNHPANCRPVEIVGQTRGVQMRLPEEGNTGGAFQILLENGDVIPCPYPAEWHLQVVGSLQANDVVLAEVKGIGEYSAEGRLRRIREIESFDTQWADRPRDGEEISFTALNVGNRQ